MGGLPSFSPIMMLSEPQYSAIHWDHVYGLEDGDPVADDAILDDVSRMLGPEIMYGSVFIRVFDGKKYFIEASPDNPHRVFLPVHCRIECTMIIRPNILEECTLGGGRPYFVNGYHDLIIKKSPLWKRHMFVITCDAGVKPFLSKQHA